MYADRALSKLSFLSNGHHEVIVDLGAQREYLRPDAPLRCDNAEAIAPNIRHVMAFARWCKHPVLSCIDSRRPGDIGDAFVEVHSPVGPIPAKFGISLLPDHFVLDSDNCLSVALDVLKRHQQVILTKHHRDPFTHPKLDRLLTELPAQRFIVCGVALEHSLRMLALGLLRRERRVTLLVDACGWWRADEADMALRQLDVKGCELMRAEEFIARSLARTSTRHRQRPGRSVA